MKRPLLSVFRLLKPFNAEDHSGIAEFFATRKGVRIGDSAFLMLTDMEPSEVSGKLKWYMKPKESVCTFTIAKPSAFEADEKSFKRITKILGGGAELTQK